MIGDPQRLQYLEAMGITTWASRYRFVNAKPSELAEWQAAPTPDKPAPGQRLQALLETSARPAEVERPVIGASAAPAQEAAAPVQKTAAPLSRARALLEGDSAQGESAGASTDKASVSRTPSMAPTASGGASELAGSSGTAMLTADPLRFTLSLSVIGERWWLMLPGERPLSSSGQALLRHMLKSVGLPADWSALSSLSWPLMSLPASDPFGEAREGIQVFCAGQAQRHGLAIEGAIVIGDEVWAPLLSESSDTVGWACHHLPHPDDLLSSADLKRECWPRLQALASAWQRDVTRPA